MDVRASDSERDATVEQLREAAAVGRLTLEELTDRIEAAANAVMRSELVPLTGDLPVAVERSHSEPGRRTQVRRHQAQDGAEGRAQATPPLTAH
jgi:hypothetical protein